MGPKYQLFLNFHGLGVPPPTIPTDEVRYWIGEELFAEVLDRVARRPEVRLTFDDGNASDFEVALPELTKRGVRAEFFVLAGRLGQPGYLDEAQLREMVAAGMGIGLHGMDHRSWAECDGGALDVEIDEARRKVEAAIGRPIVRAACPFGAYNARCLRKLKDAGFEVVYTSDGGVSGPREWLQTRNTLQSSHRLADVQALVEQPPVGLRHLTRRLRTFAKSNRRPLSG